MRKRCCAEAQPAAEVPDRPAGAGYPQLQPGLCRLCTAAALLPACLLAVSAADERGSRLGRAAPKTRGRRAAVCRGIGFEPAAGWMPCRRCCWARRATPLTLKRTTSSFSTHVSVPPCQLGQVQLGHSMAATTSSVHSGAIRLFARPGALCAKLPPDPYAPPRCPPPPQPPTRRWAC